MSTKKRLLQVRSNNSLLVNYDNLQLTPQIELILLTTEPFYDIDRKKEHIVKTEKLSEFRTFCSLEGLNEMISDLQKLACELQQFEQLSGSLNKVIEQYTKTNEQNT